ncbi:MAG TPA: DMT family transporter, partial [Clostridia bacterium]|nr:DMT family transporter [Clostridia bacterium]
ADPLVITFYTAFINCAVAIMINPGFFRLNFEITGQLIAYVVELAVISGILPVVFLYKGIRLVGAARASIVATAELPATLAISYLFLGETMSCPQLLGVLLIITAIVILQNESQLESYFRTFNSKT